MQCRDWKTLRKQNDLKMLHKKGCLILGMLNSNYMKHEIKKQILIGLFAYFSSTSLWDTALPSTSAH